ncbi:cyclic AMP-dependent transcription factor ATF-6 beta-like [Elysia marginata]|uniref:Cyclic AMP-dependent transcription factor ATF-6 beta-like n=1 Tax=Elysia marginata TaxID=1093978 RepID=A0AAV4HCH4_9GAST|nr:cyclic AMP-dependent transcription factor ATF-6 beta-like [Elysia marginata]
MGSFTDWANFVDSVIWSQQARAVTHQPVSTQFCNFHNEVTIKEEYSVGFASPHDQILLQQEHSPYSHADVIHSQPRRQQQQQQQQYDQLYTTANFSTSSADYSIVQSDGTVEAVGVASSPSSSSSSSLSCSSYEPLLSLIHSPQQPLQSQTALKMSPSSSPNAGQRHGYVVVPTSPHKPKSPPGSSATKIILNSAAGSKRHGPSVLPVQTSLPPVQLSKGVERIVSSPPASSCLSSPSSLSSTSYQIDAILNNNIRIQPKPGVDVKVSAANIQWVTSPDITNTQHQAMSVTTPQGIPIVTSPSSITTITDEKSFKRAQRIIKNRESACLSRKRKKEYMSSLEERLQQCASDNERLLRENEALRQQVNYLQRENIELKQPRGTSSPAAKKICLMCFGLLLTLNLSSLSLFGGSSDRSQPASMGITHHATGRSLLTLPDDVAASDLVSGYNAGNDSSEVQGSGPWTRFLDGGSHLKFDHELSLLVQRMNMTQRLGHMCPMYFNSTESLRLAEQLRGWMISQEEEKKKSKKAGGAANPAVQKQSAFGQDTRRQQKNKLRAKRKKDYPALRRMGAYLYKEDELNQPSMLQGGQDGRRDRMSGGGGSPYPMQLFGGGFDPREQLLDAIPRRNDTFYVLSFSTDYFLVPATAHNKTMRPRMSLLMPVVSSSLNGKYTDFTGIGTFVGQVFSGPRRFYF